MPLSPQQAQKQYDTINAPDLEKAKILCDKIDLLLTASPKGIKWSNNGTPYNRTPWIGKSTIEWVAAVYTKLGWNVTFTCDQIIMTAPEETCACGPGGCRDPNGHWSGH